MLCSDLDGTLLALKTEQVLIAMKYLKNTGNALK
jgi:hypothetical protein